MRRQQAALAALRFLITILRGRAKKSKFEILGRESVLRL